MGMAKDKVEEGWGVVEQRWRRELREREREEDNEWVKKEWEEEQT